MYGLPVQASLTSTEAGPEEGVHPVYPGPLLLTLISNYIHYIVSDEITYSFLNFNGTTVEVYEWVSNFIPHFIEHVITYPRWD